MSRWSLPPFVVVLLVLGYLPYGAGQGTTTTLVDFFILLTLGVTWNMLAGYAGLVSVGQQAYIGIGAYGVLWLAQHGIEPFIALPIAAVACAVFAVPISLLVFRLRGGYFAIGTWAVAEVLSLLTIRDSALGGGTGTNVPGLGGFDPVVLGAYTYWAALAVATSRSENAFGRSTTSTPSGSRCAIARASDDTVTMGSTARSSAPALAASAVAASGITMVR